MGSSLSTGRNHDELVDNLVESNYITKPEVEDVFRSVDRAFYFLPNFRSSAYRDSAWTNGNLHLSSPCIYTEVINHLSLKPGLSFLNIGSGTGYLSTMAGLMLGENGINHGVEIHPDVVDYAYEKLNEFKILCNAIDLYEFCEPHFVVGNGLDLNDEQKYDRIYCGASCPESHHNFLKRYLKVGGIMVVPCEDELLKITRTSENVYEKCNVLTVSFSSLQALNEKTIHSISIPVKLPSLKDVCRSKIRSIIRERIKSENSELLKKPVRIKRRNSSADQRCHFYGEILTPILIGDENESGGEDGNFGIGIDVGNIFFSNYRSFIIRDCLRDMSRIRALSRLSRIGNSVSDRSADMDLVEQDSSDSDSSISSSTSSIFSTSSYGSGIERAESEDLGQTAEGSNAFLDKSNTNEVTKTANFPACFSSSTSENENKNHTKAQSIKSKEVEQEENLESSGSPKTKKKDHKRSFSIDDESEIGSLCVNGKIEAAASFEESRSMPKKMMKREKLDSGFSEESDDSKNLADGESSDQMVIESEDCGSNSLSNTNESEQSAAEKNNEPESSHQRLMLNYRKLMEEKIQSLPLPVGLKQYLNYFREFIPIEN